MPLPPLQPLPGHPLPLLCRPDGDPRLDTLVDALTADAPHVASELVRAGAILFRGWHIPNAEDVERVARAIDPALKNDYLGTSPRNGLTRFVFSASELPGHYPIPQHNEMSFTRNPPRKLFFACLVPNRPPGGETPLVDMRQVYRD